MGFFHWNIFLLCFLIINWPIFLNFRWTDIWLSIIEEKIGQPTVIRTSSFNRNIGRYILIGRVLVVRFIRRGNWSTGENHRAATSHWHISSYILYRIRLAWVGFELTTSVEIDTDWIVSYKSNNYHMTTTTTAPELICSCEISFNL